MRAILSDIHGNLEALEAVLADARERGAQEIICLGDTVGYGPNPAECVDRARSFGVCLLGNADEEVLFSESSGTGSRTRTSAWTRAALGRDRGLASDKERWQFLQKLPRVGGGAGVLLVHASPRNPLHEYLFPDDIRDPVRWRSIWPLLERWCFVGHTHIPGIFTDANEYIAPGACGQRFTWSRGKVLVNVGSVGQPRDGDPRASYVLWDGQTVEFCRVAYNVEVTLAKIRAEAELADPQVERWLSATAGT